MQPVEHIIETMTTRTQVIFTTAHDAERHEHLMRRLYELYGALELARLLESGRLARRIASHIDAVRRDIEAD